MGHGNNGDGQDGGPPQNTRKQGMKGDGTGSAESADLPTIVKGIPPARRQPPPPPGGPGPKTSGGRPPPPPPGGPGPKSSGGGPPPPPTGGPPPPTVIAKSAPTQDLASRLKAQKLTSNVNLTTIKTKNENRRWLSYETRFNWATFSKTDQQVEATAYRVQADKMAVMLAPEEDLDDETLTNLCKVFFPTVRTPGGQVDLRKIRAIGKLPWELGAEGFAERFSARPAGRLNAAGDQGAAKQEHYIVMPYNIRDNSLSSAAMGTKSRSRLQGLQLRPFSATLPMWCTSSRSSIMDFTGVSTRDWVASAASESDVEAALWGNQYVDSTKHNRFLTPSQDAGTAFQFPADPNFHERVFSVKTGVDIIGLQVQASKAKLEHNSILAALRSAFISDVERRFGYDSYDDPNLLILKEILTITEASVNHRAWFRMKMGYRYSDERTHALMERCVDQPTFGDGLQVRSLRGMKHDLEYFPPTSIPFVGVKNFKIDNQSEHTLTIEQNDQYKVKRSDKRWLVNLGMPRPTSAFQHIDDQAWCAFWKTHYAETVGRTKARLLLRYGLQGFGGNAQNYLLETKDGKPNGRVILRDMGDYALHDFVLWAMFGPEGEPPPDSRAKGPGEQEEFVKKWSDAFGHHPLLHFECSVLHRHNNDYTDPQNPGSISEFPTWTGYHRDTTTGMNTFNPFCPACDKTGANFVGHISPLWAYALPASPQSIDFFHCDLDLAQWAKVQKVQMEWGLAHNNAWLNYIAKALNKTFDMPQPVPMSQIDDASTSKVPPRPDCYLNLDGKNSGTMANLHSGGLGGSSEGERSEEMAKFEALKGKFDSPYLAFKSWEMYLGMQVEDFLGSLEGQSALRHYLRNWKKFEAENFSR